MNDFLKRFKNKKIFVFTHNDLDGLSAIACFIYFLKPHLKKIDYRVIAKKEEIEQHIEKNLDHIKKFDYIFFTDLSPYTVEIYNKIKDILPVIIIDHHTGNYEVFKDVINKEDYYYNPDSCGAKMCFDLVTEKTRRLSIHSQFFNLINVYDTWQSKNPLFRKALDLNNLCFGLMDWKLKDKLSEEDFTYPFVDFALKKLNSDSNDLFFSQREKDIMDSGREKEKKYLNMAKKNLKIYYDNKKNPYTIINIPSKLSYVAHVILEEYNDKIYYAILKSSFWKQKDNPKVSLRSKGKVDVSMIARKYEGNGHEQAAGITFKTIEECNEVLLGKKVLIY